MVKTICSFIRAIFLLPFGWRMWAGLLMLVNMVFPLFFIGSQAAQFTLGAFLLSFIIGLVLFRRQGFTRLLGLMHFPWIFLIFYLWGVVGQTSSNNFFGIWIRVVMFLNGASLLLDIFNVFRYIEGERESIIGL